LIKDAEPLPMVDGDQHLRMGRLAEALQSRGHQVTWWASTFQHFHKKHLRHGDQVIQRKPGWEYRLIEAGGYRSNLSLARWRHHYRLARRFSALSAPLSHPDIVVAALPIPSFASAAARYCNSHGIPYLVDVRDQWPTTFLSKSPPILRPAAWAATRPMDRQVRRLFQGARGLVAVSDGYLQWALTTAGRETETYDRTIPLGYRTPELPENRTPSKDLQNILDQCSGAMIAAFVGSFGLSYDLDTVCRAASQLWEAGIRDVKFVLGGDGDQMPALRRWADRCGNIHLPGWLNAMDMDTLLRRASLGLACCISTPNTLPNKIYHYMAYGLPILSSLRGDATELINRLEIGSSYQCGDHTALAELVREWMASPDRLLASRSNARDAHDRYYSPERLDTNYLDLVESASTTPAGS